MPLGGQTGPASPIWRATVVAVAAASPVSMIGSTPSERKSVSNDAEFGARRVAEGDEAD